LLACEHDCGNHPGLTVSAACDSTDALPDLSCAWLAGWRCRNGHRAGRAVGRAQLAVPALVLVHVRLVGFRVDG